MTTCTSFRHPSIRPKQRTLTLPTHPHTLRLRVLNSRRISRVIGLTIEATGIGMSTRTTAVDVTTADRLTATQRRPKGGATSQRQSYDDGYDDGYEDGYFTSRLVRFWSPRVGVYVSSPFYMDYYDLCYDPFYYGYASPWYGWGWSGWYGWGSWYGWRRTTAVGMAGDGMDGTTLGGVRAMPGVLVTGGIPQMHTKVLSEAMLPTVARVARA